MKLLQASAADLRERPAELAAELGQAGQEIVILWAERLTAGPDGAGNAQALLELAESLALGQVSGAGLLEIPAGANGRGLREAGVLPNAAAGLRESGESGLDAQGIAAALAEGELSALLLFEADLLQAVSPELAERALERATTVVAHATFLSDALRAHASVVLPAQAYAEKEGTIVHPDGRLQRLRPAVAHPGETRAGWQVITELAARLELDLEVLTASMASSQLFDAVPFYAGLTLDEIGGRGIRWQDRPAAGAYRAEVPA
jgi:NADH-quinone oxidoreductase subunit G